LLNTINTIVENLNDFIWGIAAVFLILLTGIYFSISTRFIQIRRLRTIFKATLFNSNKKHSGEKHTVSQFQALSTALAASMGTGNIAGVASAIAIGGSGAVFWMWVSAFFGMATAYAENVLGVIYKNKVKDKSLNGPMLYLEHGLKCRPLAVVFAVCCVFASFGMGNMAQSNTVSEAVFSCFKIPHEVTGAVIALLAGYIILGGSRKTARAAEKIIPVVSLFYILGAIILIALFYKNIPCVFESILKSAFGVKAAVGGTAGQLIKLSVTTGLKRGIFSNEAGLGSSVLVHTAADCKEPVTMGMWAIVEVFIDTIICCTVTALVILCTGTPADKNAGVSVVMTAFEKGFGSFAGIFLTASTAVFAFATLLGWSFYGEQCTRYLSHGKEKSRLTTAYKVIFILLAYVGAVTGLELVWSISDVFNGIMLIPNLIGIIILRKNIVDVTNNYT